MGVTDRRTFLKLGGAAVLGARRAVAAEAAARVVIVGGGFGGGACALELRRIAPTATITLIDPDERYVSCPLSNAVITGQRTLASLTLGRSGLTRAGVQVVRASTTALDPTARQVHLHDGTVLPYDRLVIAPGIRFLFGTPQGYDEAATLRMPHAWIAGPQTRLLAAQLHAMPDGGTVAISVPIGLMRCPPGPYERASLIAHWLKEHRPRSKVLIFDANNHFPRQDVFESAWREQYPGRIEWIAPGEGGAVERIDTSSGTLYSSSGAHRVAVANIIPPQAPASIALDAGLAAGHGWCPTHPETFESESIPGVYVIGDACIAGAMPKSASAARSQGLRCAAAIAAALSGRPQEATALSSVCYSLLAPQSAFAMRARFQSADGDIRQLAPDASQSAELTPSAQHAAQAAAWYEQMRRSCLGA